MNTNETITETTRKSFTIDAEFGPCGFSKEVTLTFNLFTLSIAENGALEVRPNVPENASFDEASSAPIQRASHLDDNSDVDVSQYQPDYADLAYDNQDEFTQRFANAEHVALHLWIDEMGGNPL